MHVIFLVRYFYSVPGLRSVRTEITLLFFSIIISRRKLKMRNFSYPATAGIRDYNRIQIEPNKT